MSNEEIEHMIENCFHSFHSYEEEIAEKINQRDRDKGNVVKNFETNHKYIDFTYTIIGEKVKSLSKIDAKEDLKFDDIYYSAYMLKCNANNSSSFYLKESV